MPLVLWRTCPRVTYCPPKNSHFGMLLVLLCPRCIQALRQCCYLLGATLDNFECQPPSHICHPGSCTCNLIQTCLGCEMAPFSAMLLSVQGCCKHMCVTHSMACQIEAQLSKTHSAPALPQKTKNLQPNAPRLEELAPCICRTLIQRCTSFLGKDSRPLPHMNMSQGLKRP